MQEDSANFHPGHISRDTFQALLSCYPATLAAVTRRKATDRILLARSKRTKRSRPASPPEAGNAQLDEEQTKQVEAEVEAFRALDALRYEVLPGEVARRGFLEKEEVVSLVEWKLKHGVFRPTLLGMVKANQATTVQKSTSDAFQAATTTTTTTATSVQNKASKAGNGEPETAAEFPKTSLDALMNPLRGVGIATASLLLSVGTTMRDPEHEAPFYSDDTYLWLCLDTFPRIRRASQQNDQKSDPKSDPKSGQKLGKRKKKKKAGKGEINVKYNVAEYRLLWTAVRELRARLNEAESSAGAVSGADIEKVALVLRHIGDSGYLEEYGLVALDDDDDDDEVEGIHEAQVDPDSDIKEARTEGRRSKRTKKKA